MGWFSDLFNPYANLTEEKRALIDKTTQTVVWKMLLLAHFQPKISQWSDETMDLVQNLLHVINEWKQINEKELKILAQKPAKAPLLMQKAKELYDHSLDIVFNMNVEKESQEENNNRYLRSICEGVMSEPRVCLTFLCLKAAFQKEVDLEEGINPPVDLSYIKVLRSAAPALTQEELARIRALK